MNYLLTYLRTDLGNEQRTDIKNIIVLYMYIVHTYHSLEYERLAIIYNDIRVFIEWKENNLIMYQKHIFIEK